MQQVSEELIRELYGQDEADLVLLVTLEVDGLADLGLFTDRADTVVTPDGERVAGFISRGQVFRHLPFNFRWGGAGPTEVARRAMLEVGADGRLVEAVRLAPAGAQFWVTVEMVRASAPDQVERALRSAKVPSSQLDLGKMIFELRARSLADEYACAARYTMARAPGLYA